MSKQYQNLMSQLDRLHRHNRQGSYRTRARYYEAMQRFCRFLADRYRLERLANIAPKHLAAYAAFLLDAGKAPSTIKTDLAAIRFYHDRMDHPRYELPGNELLALPAAPSWAWTAPGARPSSAGCSPMPWSWAGRT